MHASVVRHLPELVYRIDQRKTKTKPVKKCKKKGGPTAALQNTTEGTLFAQTLDGDHRNRTAPVELLRIEIVTTVDAVVNTDKTLPGFAAGIA